MAVQKYIIETWYKVTFPTNGFQNNKAEMYKIKSRFTGHGHNGNVNCCEWDSKDHFISVDGTNLFSWEIWEETACGDNPNISQGGTWPYAREGWCPGDLATTIATQLNLTAVCDVGKIQFQQPASNPKRC